MEPFQESPEQPLTWGISGELLENHLEEPENRTLTQTFVPVTNVVVEEGSVTNYQAEILQHLVDVKAAVKVLLDRFNHLNTANHTDGGTVNTTLLPSLPCNTIAELGDLDRIVLSNEDAYKELKRKLSLIGGYSYKNCVDRCLATIFTDALAVNCSWTGQKENFKVKGLKFIEAVRTAIKRLYPRLLERNLEVAIMDYFRYATQRLKRADNEEQAAAKSPGVVAEATLGNGRKGKTGRKPCSFRNN